MARKRFSHGIPIVTALAIAEWDLDRVLYRIIFRRHHHGHEINWQYEILRHGSIRPQQVIILFTIARTHFPAEIT